MEHLHFFERELIQEANVLIVENNPDFRYFLEVLFQGYGASVMACGSIKEALASLDSCVPDIVICEIRFTDESIVSLIGQVKRIAAVNDREIPIIIASTYTLADFVHNFHYLTAEIAAYLLKPIDINDFINTALKLLHAKGGFGQYVITNALPSCRGF